MNMEKKKETTDHTAELEESYEGWEYLKGEIVWRKKREMKL